jgi:hypothetical protein
MRNITLISTNHKEIGKCNSEELYKIVESINPEVIFEELSGELFDIIYNANSLNLPPDVITEIKCVKKYVQNYKIEHIPVDIDLRYISDKEQNWMFDTFEKYDDYNKIDEEQYLLTEEYGFNFLNSDKCLNLSEQNNIIKKNIIGVDLNKNELFRVHELFNRQDDNRENAMLQNIYNYSKENQYNRAVFLLGCAHRISIIEKIKEFEKLSKIKLNWTIHSAMNKKTCL